MAYYSLKQILATNADYNLIFGERSNGKTYAALEYAIKQFVETGKQTAYIRRWREDFRGKRAENLFANLVTNGVVEKLTNKEYNAVAYMGSKWYLGYVDSHTRKRKVADKPFAFAFSLSEQEHEKSSSYPDVTTVIFDEFLTRQYYLADEFMLFMNLLSTIVRQRNDVKVFMLGNTVNKYCPYFAEMGLNKIPRMKQGTIDLYSLGQAKIAVEYCAPTASKKASNKYFCFDNQNLEMITGGKWELGLYPHLPHKYAPKDVNFVFYIQFKEDTLQANAITVGNDNFLFIHRKTTPIKDFDNQLVYSLEATSKPNVKRRLIGNADTTEQRITKYFYLDKVFYQDNEIGEIVRNYLQNSSKNYFTK